MRTIDWAEFARTIDAEGDALAALALAGEWLDSAERGRALASDDGSKVTYRWIKALDVAQWHHNEGETISGCGRRLGVTRQRAQQLLWLVESEQKFDVPDRAADDARARARVLARVFSESVAILRHAPGKTVHEMAEQISCDEVDVSLVLGPLAAFTINPSLSTRLGRSKWSDDQIASTLRDCYAANDNVPLTKRAYAELTAKNSPPPPSQALIAKRFGTWNEALVHAGLPSNDRPHEYTWAHTREEALGNMVEFVLATGKTSVGAYSAWSEKRDDVIRFPHAVVGEGQSWTDAIRQVFAVVSRPPHVAAYRSVLLARAGEQAAALAGKFDADFAARL